MNNVIQQKVKFTDTTSAELFDIYMTPEKHSAIHGGANVSISELEGDFFSLLNGNLTGKNLRVVPNRMIVQSWRGTIWKEDDLDSILILLFSDTETGAQIEVIHSCTPEQFTERWEEVYWTPIREYLAKK